MNVRIVALTCALSAAACGGADARPAQDPASANANVAPTYPTVAPTNATDTSVHNGANSSVAATQTPAATDHNATPPTTTDSSAAGTPAVTNNQGVADHTKDADNTKINERDRHSSLTPMDQANNGSDTKITAAIRRGIMADKTLSFTAKNVKIITIGSKVTLRGPVKSDQEKTAIEAVAKQTAGVGEVDDQLEVKTKN